MHGKIDGMALRRWRACVFALLACGLAGVARSDSQPGFDHNFTRFPLTGGHSQVPCETCHMGGRFLGTPLVCDDCHDGTGRIATTARSSRHVPITSGCGDCHTTRTWMSARMDHSVVTSRCDGCHYLGMADAKPGDHMSTSSQCDLCHRISSWTVTHFNHAHVTAACSSCHNDVNAMGKGVQHLVTNAECDLCHSRRRWVPATFDHATVMGACSSCHDGTTATGEPTDHFQSTSECDACHTTTRWTAARYDHRSAAYPGEHRSTRSCQDCHMANSDLVSWPSPTYRPECGGCHANDFKADSHKKVEGPDIKYNVSELRDCAGACHEYTDPSLTVIKKRRNSEHRVGDGEF